MSNIEEMKNVLDDGVKEIWWFCLTELLIVYQKCSRLVFLSVNLSLTQWSSDLSAFQHKVTFFWAELGLNGVVMLFLVTQLFASPGRYHQSVPGLCRWPERFSSLTPDFPPSQRRDRSLPHTDTSAHQQLQLPTRLPPKDPEQTLTHLAVSAAVWAGWWHRCGGTSGHCRGAAPPPGTAAWSPTGGCRPEESWEGCWPAPEPDRRRPPRGCCLWPESHEGVWSDCRWDLTSPWGNSLCWE